jgi:hypothetical protein
MKVVFHARVQALWPPQGHCAKLVLWKRMGLKLKMGTSFRPQIDGQTKRVNLVIQKFF